LKRWGKKGGWGKKHHGHNLMGPSSCAYMVRKRIRASLGGKRGKIGKKGKREGRRGGSRGESRKTGPEGGGKCGSEGGKKEKKCEGGGELLKILNEGGEGTKRAWQRTPVNECNPRFKGGGVWQREGFRKKEIRWGKRGGLGGELGRPNGDRGLAAVFRSSRLLQRGKELGRTKERKGTDFKKGGKGRKGKLCGGGGGGASSVASTQNPYESGAIKDIQKGITGNKVPKEKNCVKSKAKELQQPTTREGGAAEGTESIKSFLWNFRPKNIEKNQKNRKGKEKKKSVTKHTVENRHRKRLIGGTGGLPR